MMEVDKMSEWISVKERLPEEPMRCLVYAKRGKYGGCGVVYYNQGFYGDEYGAITHWMPLPEPPEVKS